MKLSKFVFFEVKHTSHPKDDEEENKILMAYFFKKRKNGIFYFGLGNKFEQHWIMNYSIGLL